MLERQVNNSQKTLRVIIYTNNTHPPTQIILRNTSPKAIKELYKLMMAEKTTTLIRTIHTPECACEGKVYFNDIVRTSRGWREHNGK